MSIHPSIMAMYGGSNTNCLFIHWYHSIPIPVYVQLSCGTTTDSWATTAAMISSDGTGGGGEHRINFNDKPEEFLMYIYKVKRCTKTSSHDWTECPYAHPGEKARRRDPKKYPYSGIACPGYRQTGQCQQGHNCAYAHGVFEFWLHPTRYRTRLCEAGDACTRRVCFFAHTLEQLRPEVIRDCIRSGIGCCVAKPSLEDMPAVGAAATSSFASAFLVGMNGFDGNGLLGASFYSPPPFQAGMDEVNGNDLAGGGEEWCDFPHRDLVEGLLIEKGEGERGRGVDWGVKL